jgi:hypothetical protein
MVRILHGKVGASAGSIAKKGWWANMTPEYRAAYLTKKTQAIAAAHARKKRMREGSA